MQKIKMLQTAGSREKGKTYDIEDKEAVELLTHGQAIRVKTKPSPLPPKKDKE